MVLMKCEHLYGVCRRFNQEVDTNISLSLSLSLSLSVYLSVSFCLSPAVKGTELQAIKSELTQIKANIEALLGRLEQITEDTHITATGDTHTHVYYCYNKRDSLKRNSHHLSQPFM